jgi:hypothetical protein
MLVPAGLALQTDGVPEHDTVPPEYTVVLETSHAPAATPVATTMPNAIISVTNEARTDLTPTPRPLERD